MGGPSDKNDKTQLLSDSQVVEVKPATSGDKNDRSVWKGMVVGADEFALPPAKQPSRAPWIVAAVVGAGAIGGGLYWFVLRDKSSAPAPADARPVDAARPDAAPPPDAAPRPDAAPPDAPVDAAPADAAAEDAGVPPDAGAPKAVTKKRPQPIKKKPKKKPATKSH